MVSQAALEILLRQLGPARGLVEKLLRENATLRDENSMLRGENKRLTEQAHATSTMKRRSPAFWRFRVLSWELGEQTFYPKDHPQGKTTPNLRIHIPLDEASAGPPYWDITSKKLMAMLLPLLPQLAGTNTYVEVTKDGDGFATQYSVTIRPA